MPVVKGDEFLMASAHRHLLEAAQDLAAFTSSMENRPRMVRLAEDLIEAAGVCLEWEMDDRKRLRGEE